MIILTKFISKKQVIYNTFCVHIEYFWANTPSTKIKTTSSSTVANQVLMDKILCNEEKVQRVFHYLKKIITRQDLDEFEPKFVNSEPEMCLHLLLE